MIIKELTLQNFRNIEKEKIEPSDGMNVICGENAQGKTNLLEAIWLFTGAKSFRGAKEKEMVSLGCEKAKLSLSFIGEEIEKEAEIEICDKRSVTLNKNKLKSAIELAGSFNAISFSPADLRLVTDGPAVRRRFLDLAIGQLYPKYIETLREYLRAVTQRNTCLKDFRYDSTVSIMLDVFEEEIEDLGTEITNTRKKYIEKINLFLAPLYDGISQGKEKLETEYFSTFGEGNIKEKLKNSRKEDMFSLVTPIGPHRDDIIFKINGLNARNFGSQGQKRSVALSLKLAEAEVIKQNVGECPVCLMDDVMSELDPARQNFVLNKIEGMQTFLTCCDPENVKNLKAGKIFTAKKGKFF